MAFSSMVTRSTLVPLGTSSCSIRNHSLILSRPVCTRAKQLRSPEKHVRGIREIRLQFSHVSYLGGEALRVLGQDSRGYLGLGRLPARTALHLVGADGLRLCTLHVRVPKAVGRCKEWR
jgi:hypothetical protein